MTNSEVAEIFEEIAVLLAIKGDNPFRIRSYERVVQFLTGLSHPVSEMIRKKEDLTQYQGIGQDLAHKIEEAVQTGTVELLEELKKKIPESLVELTHIPDLGPKRVKTLYKELGIQSIEDLEQAALDQKVRSLPGFAEKSEQKILEQLKDFKQRSKQKRFLWWEAQEPAEKLKNYLLDVSGVTDVRVAGSYRRCKATVGDLDILVTCRQPTTVMNQLVRFGEVERVIAKGTTKTSLVLRSHLQVDVRVIPRKSWGAALHYFTGSKEHNVTIRKRAIEQKLKVSEYGVFRGDKQIGGKSEDELYDILGLSYIAPELRENNGEIEAAELKTLPNLIEPQDIKGDLHSHTTATDGRHSLVEMAEAARQRNYQYLAISDHSQRVRVAKGLDVVRLEEQLEEIDELNEAYEKQKSNFRLLKGIEVDILEDGTLDVPASILEKLDVVVGSVHYNTKLSQKKMTERVIRAMDNRCLNILGHPTGRMIQDREPYDIDLERVMRAALERGCFLEVNCQPKRLDLEDKYIKMAKEIGVKLAISTDAHSVFGLDFMKMGIGQARRGWLEKNDVINTRTWRQLEKLLNRS